MRPSMRPLISPLLRKALSDITRRKGRAALMLLGVCLGVAGVTAVTQATSLLGGAFFYTTDASAAPNITVAVDTLPASVASALENLPNVARMQVRTVYANAPWMLPNAGGVVSIQLNASPDAANTPFGAFQVTSGRLPGPGEVVMDGSDQAIQRLALGDTITVGSLDGRWIALRVVGFGRTRGGGLWHSRAQAIAYVSEEGIAQFAPGAGAARVLGSLGKGPPQFYGSEILVRTQDVGTVWQTAALIAQTLHEDDVHVLDSQTRIADGDADSQLTVSGLLALMRALALIAALLTSVLIFNTVATLLTEQTAVIGTMKALGGTRWRIGWSYLTSITLATLVGAALGVDLGLLAGYQLATQLGSVAQQEVGPFAVAPLALLVGVVVGLLAPLLASLPPLWNATRIPVREAMAAYGVRGAAPEGRRARWRVWVAQPTWLGLRNLGRRPGRTTLTSGVLTLACAIFMAAQLINASLGMTLAQGFATLSFHSDLRIRLDAPAATTQALAALRTLPNVTHVDAIDDELVTIAHGEVDLHGLSAQTPLYQPRLVTGRWLQPGDLDTLVVNDVAASRLRLQVGQRVTVDLFTTRGEEARQAAWRIIGVVHDVTAVDGGANPQGRQGLAFTTLEGLNQLRGLPADAAERLWLQARDHSPAALSATRGQAQRLLQALGLGGNLDIQFTQDDLGALGPLPIIYGLFDAMAVLVALMGALSLTHTIAATVLERRREIGVLRALGATGWRVGVVFMTEGLAMVVVAWAAGILIGLPIGLAGLTFLGSYFGPFDVSFDPLFVVATLAFAVAIAGVAGALPAVGASRVRVRAALQYE